MQKSSKEIAAYCRVSTLDQKKNGLGMDIQVRDVTVFATSRGIKIDRLYRDEGESGAAENRKQLTRLVRHCERGLISAVIIPSLDRLSRDVRIAENLFWKFEQLGIRVLIVDMPHYNAANRRDVLIRQIREAIAEDNRKEIIERLWKGRHARIRKGKAPGGTPPYGYRRVAKRLVAHPHEAEIIRVIFALSALRYSSSKIANELTEKRYYQRNGKAWSARQVRSICARRSFYEKGMIRYGETVGVNRDLILINNDTVLEKAWG